MKTILLVSTLLTGSSDGSDGNAAAETTAEFASQKACVTAVEIRTGLSMTPTKGGARLTLDLNLRRGNGVTIYVCSPYGLQADE